MDFPKNHAGGRLAIPALVLAAWLAGATTVAWRGLGEKRNRIGPRLARLITGQGRTASKAKAANAGPAKMSDPRLTSLREAALSWQRSTASRRVVVDQVCLVPDAAAFFEAIAAWDERYFFPILIDEPAWTLPFLRAFRPARVVRYAGRNRPRTRRPEPSARNVDEVQNALWWEASRAVSRAWSGTTESDGVFPDAGSRPRELGLTAPGVVLSAPDAPMLAGAVALAAGHFQPLVRLPTPHKRTAGSGDSDSPPQFGDILSLPRALNLALRVEWCVNSLDVSYDRLGDECDFLTIAADWPYRYSYDQGDDLAKGIYAIDDLVGRKFDLRSRTYAMTQTRQRWAYTGRLLGDSAASVARAMGALFLQPASALLWNTYGGGPPWSDYAMGRGASELSRIVAVVDRTGRQAELGNWHRTFDPVNRFGMLLINSSGGPDSFRITGGTGRPSDIPRGAPTAVAMIHSFSAADPSDAQTIAGRWLAQGAFTYFGSVNEPFLAAFRAPALVSELMAAGLPFVAALRQGENETFGFPWRLSYLGDPLFHLENTAVPLGPNGIKERITPAAKQRLDPTEWRKAAPAEAGWPVADITLVTPLTARPGNGPNTDSEDDRFRWCRDATIAALAGPTDQAVRPLQPTWDGWQTQRPTVDAGGCLPVLRTLHRDRLSCDLRPFFDDLVIDALEEAGLFDELTARLVQIPLAERKPRVWQAQERSGMTRLARLDAHGSPIAGFLNALDLWDEVMSFNWPKDSHFPAHFTERVAALCSTDAHRRHLWLIRLRRAAVAMAADPARHPHAAVVAAERRRLEDIPGELRVHP